MSEPAEVSNNPRWLRSRLRVGDRRLDGVAGSAAMVASLGGLVAGFASLSVSVSDPTAVARFVGAELLLTAVWPLVIAALAPWVGVDPARQAALTVVGFVGLASTAICLVGALEPRTAVAAAGVASIGSGVAWAIVCVAMTSVHRRSCWLVVACTHLASGVVLLGVSMSGVSTDAALVLVAGTFVWLALGDVAAIAISRLQPAK